MAKRKTFSKTNSSITKLPKGLPIRSSSSSSHASTNGGKKKKMSPTTTTTISTTISPFEMTQRMKRPKFAVHNRTTNGTTTTASSSSYGQQQRLSALAVSLSQRQQSIVSVLQQQKKSNQFLDQRIGEQQQQQQQQRNNKNRLVEVQDKNLARLVRERTQQSKRLSKYALQENGNNDHSKDDNNDAAILLTHKGRAIQDMKDEDHIILSDDDDDNDNLDAYDTELHFGGGQLQQDDRKKQQQRSIYGPNTTSTTNTTTTTTSKDLLQTYTQKKLDLDDLIVRRKTMKLERIKAREEQLQTFDTLDTQFQEIASLLQFRNKDEEIYLQTLQKRNRMLSQEDIEYDEWDREMKSYTHLDKKQKIAASDRTKTLEEMAQEEAQRLQQLEQRRLARMNGTYIIEEDDNSDDDDDIDHRKKYKQRRSSSSSKLKQQNKESNPEELDYDDDDDDTKKKKKSIITTRFTSEGLVYINQDDGVVLGKVGEIKDPSSLNDDTYDDGDTETDDENINNSSSNDDDDDTDNDDDDDDDNDKIYDDHDDGKDSNNNNNESAAIIIREYKVGDQISAVYRAKEQFDGHQEWYSGVIVSKEMVDNNNDTNRTKNTTTEYVYNIEYDDGDYEENVEAQYIRPATLSNDNTITKNSNKLKDKTTKEEDEIKLKRKRKEAMEKARFEVPYVFEVPTTLDSLHTLIGKYAKTGNDVSLIIERIHKTNSVRLDRRNSEKMQNFYDVLLRRFVAVGDAIHTSGDGGEELCRYQQLDAITKILYTMAQEAPDVAGAVWGRRLGVLHNAYTKRLRDFGMIPAGTTNDPESTPWPSTGVILLLRALGHVFPVTDRRHYVVTPTLLFLGQMLGHTPITSVQDLVMGILCCALLLEYTTEAKRIAPEAHAFLASIIRLYAWSSSDREGLYALPTIQAACKIEPIATLRMQLHDTDTTLDTSSTPPPQLSIEASQISNPQISTAILYATLQLVESSIKNLSGSIERTENEVFAEIVNSLILLQPPKKEATTVNVLPKILKDKVASVVALLSSCTHVKRMPLQRRSSMVGERTIVTLAPRMENPDRYSVTQKDRHKSATQAAADRTRREYKREHKAVSRELRLDASMIETERRRVQDEKDRAAKAKRQRAYAWLEGEQASMNQQVRQGGGLLKGGGMGAAKAKAASGKVGIKKGGKLR